MKGKINESGWLYIERAGSMKGQECPLQENSSCGDWCPAFREPAFHRCEKALKNWKYDATIEFIIKLCKEVGVLFFDEFTDERGKKEDKAGKK